jgi:hypothetical protein
VAFDRSGTSRKNPGVWSARLSAWAMRKELKPQIERLKERVERIEKHDAQAAAR